MMKKFIHLLCIILLLCNVMNVECRPFSEKSRILIVGAGPAGLHMASRLVKHGYKNITILEKTHRVGGKAFTIYMRPDGSRCRTWSERKHNIGTPQDNEDLCIPIEMGACFTHNGYHGVFELAKELGLPGLVVPVGRAVYSDLIDPSYYESSSMAEYVGAVVEDYLKSKNEKSSASKIGIKLLKAIGRYAKIHANYMGRLRPYSFNPKAPPSHLLRLLNNTFGSFLRGHQLDPIIGFLSIAQAAQGYGYLSEVSAYYGLLWISPELLHGYAQHAIHHGKTMLSKVVRFTSRIHNKFGLWTGRVLTSIFTGNHAESVRHTTSTWRSGYQSFWEEIYYQYKDRVNIKFGARIIEIDRHLDLENRAIEVKYFTVDKAGKRVGPPVREEYDFLIYGGRLRAGFIGQKVAMENRVRIMDDRGSSLPQDLLDQEKKESREFSNFEAAGSNGDDDTTSNDLRRANDHDDLHGSGSGGVNTLQPPGRSKTSTSRIKKELRRKKKKKTKKKKERGERRRRRQRRRSNRRNNAAFVETNGEDRPNPRGVSNVHEFNSVFKRTTSNETDIFGKLTGATITTTLYKSVPVHGYCTDFENCNPVLYNIYLMHLKNETKWYGDRFDAVVHLGKRGLTADKKQVRVAFQYEYYDALDIARVPPLRPRPILLEQFKKDLCERASLGGRHDLITPDKITLLPQPDNGNSAQFSWPYFDHFERLHVAKGYPWKLWDLQGQHKTWYIGGSVVFESIHDIINYNCQLLFHHLGIVCDYVQKFKSDAVAKEIREMEKLEGDLCWKLDKDGKKVIVDCVKVSARGGNPHETTLLPGVHRVRGV